MRRAIKSLKIKNFYINKNINLIIRRIEKLIIKKNILKYTNNKLIEILIEEKKRCKRDKLIGLLSPDAFK